jgi:hypothetical protein
MTRLDRAKKMTIKKWKAIKKWVEDGGDIIYARAMCGDSVVCGFCVEYGDNGVFECESCPLDQPEYGGYCEIWPEWKDLWDNDRILVLADLVIKRAEAAVEKTNET